MNLEHYADGQASVAPDEVVAAGSRGRWTLTLAGGETEFPVGASIRIRIPQGFSAPQAHHPEAPGYVRARATNYETSIAVAVEPLPGGREDADATGSGILLIVQDAPVRAGQHIAVEYGADPGCAFASTFAGKAVFEVRIRRTADSDFLPIRDHPVVYVSAGAMARLEAVASSPGKDAESFAVRVIARDAYGNRCKGWTGWLAVTPDRDGLKPPPIQRVEDVTGDGVTVEVRLAGPREKPIRLTVREQESGCETVTNPVLSDGTAPLWGDTHACIEDDHPSRAELDFELAVGTDPDMDSFAFEAAGAGHETSTRPVLRCSLPDTENEAMLSTHLLEIYSAWGCRERWACPKPDIRLDRDDARTAQAVLASGVVAGFGAGSNSRLGVGGDAVAAEPGKGYAGGLTAVFADSVSEDAIFRALRERRCYATTGHRPLLSFTVNGAPMGSLVEVDAADRAPRKQREVRANVHGTGVVEQIEVIRNNTQVCTYRGDGADVSFRWIDEQDLERIALPRTVRGPGRTAYYYLRVTQEDGEVAWTSPVWFVLR